MTVPKEMLLSEMKMKALAQDRDKWVSLVFFLVSKFGENYKLVIPESSKIQVPTIDNQLTWEYNAETDIVTFEIKEVEEKRIVTLE